MSGNMNIAIIGYGNMGKVVERLAKEKGIAIKSIIDPKEKGATHKEISPESMKGVDVAIEFSSPEAVQGNVEKIGKFKVSHVLATTGWNNKLEDVKKIVQANGNGVVYGSNFSIGVNVFYKILEQSAKLFNRVKGYDVFGYELHHSKKKDSPSGTAKTLGEILLENFPNKKKLVFGKLERQILPEELHFASVRGGNVPGTHSISFDSSADTIELSHVARSREGFAAGALLAAEWVKGRKGFFPVQMMFEELLD